VQSHHCAQAGLGTDLDIDTFQSAQPHHWLVSIQKSASVRGLEVQKPTPERPVCARQATEGDTGRNSDGMRARTEKPLGTSIIRGMERRYHFVWSPKASPFSRTTCPSSPPPPRLPKGLRCRKEPATLRHIVILVGSNLS